ncbi:MAG: hypothetical protein WAX07_08630 [Candidatus Altiarchaeia archaeon]
MANSRYCPPVRPFTGLTTGELSVRPTLHSFICFTSSPGKNAPHRGGRLGARNAPAS